MKVIKELIDKGSFVIAYDPKASRTVKDLFPHNFNLKNSMEDALKESDFVLILTEWDEFKNKELLKNKTIFEGRRLFDTKKDLNIEGVCW